MNVGSLFSGIGGIELGFERQGYKTKWFVENNPFCQAILRKHWKNTPIYSDITKVNFTKLPKVDILTGGFPCQDISIAGKRKGITGKRSGLWTEYFRAIREIRPRYAIIENVPNLLNLGLNKVLANLAQIRYDAEWFCIQASDVGALHKRKRIFIIAYPNTIRGDDGNDLDKENISKCIHNKKRNSAEKNWERIQKFRIDKDTKIFVTNPLSKRCRGGVMKHLNKRRMMQKFRDEVHRLYLPTIGANEYKGSGKNRYLGSKDFRGAKMSEGLRTCSTDKIYLNPSFAEVVMGFPAGWTELSPAEMQLFLKSQNLLQKRLKKQKKRLKEGTGGIPPTDKSMGILPPIL